jgi:meso-butanediol dehydrogenase / (S,S)-butanediol dehydrogenase / diacetyl reductase
MAPDEGRHVTSLKGKVALVTGASSGLGAAAAAVFAEHGATVFGIARDSLRMSEIFAAIPGGRHASVDIAACREALAACVADSAASLCWSTRTGT